MSFLKHFLKSHHQESAFSYVIVRYDPPDHWIALIVCFATCYEEAVLFLQVFIEYNDQFAPGSIYAIRTIEEVARRSDVYQQAL